MLTPDAAIDVLVRFSRLAAGATDAGEIPPLLAGAGVDHLGADGAAVVRLDLDGRARMAAARNLPAEAASLDLEVEILDAELGERLRKEVGCQFARSHTMPLVAGGDLFGALVLLFHEGRAQSGDQRRLGEGLLDLAATALAKAHQLAELRRSYDELRSSREILAQTLKLRALGQMAAGISHDLKNLLNPLGLQIQLLKRKVGKDEAGALRVIGNMEDVVRQGVQTIERLRDFSRQQPEAPPEPLDLNTPVSDAIELCRPRLSADDRTILLDQELGAPPRVLVRGSELVNALVNLIVNAIDAVSRQHGRIMVRTGESPGFGWVSVSDNGPGMPPEVERRIFEPFFTTKGAEGTGLGLAMVYAIVQRHGGTIDVVTKEGAGTTLTLRFPAVS